MLVKAFLVITLFNAQGQYVTHKALEFPNSGKCIQNLPATRERTVPEGTLQFRCVEFKERKIPVNNPLQYGKRRTF